ncbi:peptidylprolyl isomerase [Thetidibacter halocola]|uniref:Parvulin-like PPIase n=1 Tax=Thetidibacter halocola TaxID=2827239 RepID=A0A8J8BAW9_9RHOB|nr:peptidylprolyl isomerase [Thetidibacter halocola]MBS0125658.1 peptidylprolyl isomerase [Thetidibacter halocola]
MSMTLLKRSVAALALLASPLAAEEMTASTVVATVNGTEITLAHMLMVRASLPEQYQELPADVLWDGILDQLIQQESLAQDPRAEVTRKAEIALENERRSLLAAEVIGRVARDAITDEAVQAAYDAQYVNGDAGTEYNAAHILVETEEEAAAIAAEIAGGADFAELARTRSTGPSGPSGGALGWFGPGMMVAPFQTAVEQLTAGQVSAPVQTQFGWHVIKLNETRTQQAPALDAVREQIEGQLQQDAVNALIDGLVEQAEVTRTDKAEIDTSILSNLDLLED